jgi:hypothetical protein
LEVDYDIDEVLEGVTGSIGEDRKSTYGISAVTAAQLLLQRISSKALQMMKQKRRTDEYRQLLDSCGRGDAMRSCSRILGDRSWKKCLVPLASCCRE